MRINRNNHSNEKEEKNNIKLEDSNIPTENNSGSDCLSMDREDKKEKKEDENNMGQKQNKTDFETEISQLKDKLLRTLAELENTRRIAVEEKEKTRKFALTNFAKDLIVVMEDFFLAMDHVNKINEENEIFKSFYEGIELTFSELKKVFDKQGIVRLYPLGERFDPNFHEAIAYVEKEGTEEGTIIEVMQAGYTLNDRVIKPAIVAVSR